MSYGYAEENGKQVFYFHSAGEGRKVDLVKKAPKVGFELDTGYRLQAEGPAHECTAAFQSIIGTGVTEFVTGIEEKIRALDCIMVHYRGKAEGNYPADLLERVCIFKMTVTELACKEHE
jgi:nitroimidazol reductase NimA-like FMN-containing flavoprotein (pyridoxamine 5'-phosphate oxidase superfamily)